MDCFVKRQSTKEIMLWLHRLVAFVCDVGANKFHAFWEKWHFLRLSEGFCAQHKVSWHCKYWSAMAYVIAQLKMSYTINFVLVLSSMTIPLDLAICFQELSMSCLNMMKIVGPLTGPNGITWYVYFDAHGPENANYLDSVITLWTIY